MNVYLLHHSRSDVSLGGVRTLREDLAKRWSGAGFPMSWEAASILTAEERAAVELTDAPGGSTEHHVNDRVPWQPPPVDVPED